MMTCFSPLSFLPMKKIGETNCDGPSLIRPSAFSCLIHISLISPSALDHGYGLHLIEVGASGRNLIDMFELRFGGNRFESSSENTLQWCLNSFGIVSIIICTHFISSRHSTPQTSITSISSEPHSPLLIMTNYKKDYEEQHLSKDEQYYVLTCNMPYRLAYLSRHDQEAIGLDALGDKPTPTEVDSFIHHMGLNPSSITIQ